jgi:beta-aspartyl-dipeptidase (metallo-type)
MDCLFRLVKDYEFPISAISPTHVGRTKDLFEEAIQFALLGGSIDITTGASKYAPPHQSVLLALEKGVSSDLLTFSSDGNAGLDKLDEQGKLIGFRRAPIQHNYTEFKALAQTGIIPLETALKVITSNPAKNLGLKNKGVIAVGADADFCVMDDQLNLLDVFAKGQLMMENQVVIKKGFFEA